MTIRDFRKIQYNITSLPKMSGNRWCLPACGMIGTKNENIRSFTIITTAANDFMKPIHDRMPLILKPEFWRKWIAPDAGLSEIDKILEQPVGNDVLQNWEVGPYVNNAAHEGACCIARINFL